MQRYLSYISCKNCKYYICSHPGIHTCDNCHCPNLATDGRLCNCLTESEENEESCPYFVDSIKDLINSLTISQRKFCKEVGIDRSTIYNIMHDVHTPSNLTIKIICDYFGVDYRNYLRSRKNEQKDKTRTD